MDKGLLVRKIRDGTVIDHIPPGNALNVIRILGIAGEDGSRLSIIMNTDSSKLGKKDIVKIEGRELTMDEVDIIALIAPTATINIIRDYEVVSKKDVSIPDTVEGVVKCANPNCISNAGREKAIPKFKVVSKDPLILKCIYCERYTTREDILRQFIAGEEG